MDVIIAGITGVDVIDVDADAVADVDAAITVDAVTTMAVDVLTTTATAAAVAATATTAAAAATTAFVRLTAQGMRQGTGMATMRASVKASGLQTATALYPLPKQPTADADVTPAIPVTPATPVTPVIPAIPAANKVQGNCL